MLDHRVVHLKLTWYCTPPTLQWKTQRLQSPAVGKTKQKTTCVKNREQLGRGGGSGWRGRRGGQTLSECGARAEAGIYADADGKQGRTRVTRETKNHLGKCSVVFFSPLHLVEFKFRASWGSWWKNDRKNSGGKWDPKESLSIYPRADNACSLNTQRLSHQKGTMQTGGRQVIRELF